VLAQKRDYPKLMIVEGIDDRHSVVGLMRDHVNWPEEPKDWPVYIEVAKSVDEILATGYISTEIKARNIKIVGVMLDADLNADGRYRESNSSCQPSSQLFLVRCPQTV
jgi:hypothetical protein